MTESGQTFAAVWGETVHQNRGLRVLAVMLVAVIGLLVVLVMRLAWMPAPKPIVVRVDEVGRAEAVAYEALEARADPLDPTTKYFLTRWVYDHYSRRAATVEAQWTRSLEFLTPSLANGVFLRESAEIAAAAGGRAAEERRVENVVLRVQAQPQEPHGATADFEIVRVVDEREVGREPWSVSLQFRFLPEIGPDRVAVNPMGLTITYIQPDAAVQTADPS